MALEFACFDVVLAFAALFGLAAFFTLRCRVHSALSPLVSLCSVSLVLAAAGVAGVLRPAVWAPQYADSQHNIKHLSCLQKLQ